MRPGSTQAWVSLGRGVEDRRGVGVTREVRWVVRGQVESLRVRQGEDPGDSGEDSEGGTPLPGDPRPSSERVPCVTARLRIATFSQGPGGHVVRGTVYELLNRMQQSPVRVVSFCPR